MPDEAPQGMILLGPPSAPIARELGFLAGICLFPMIAGSAGVRRVGGAFAASISRQRNLLFFQIAAVGMNALLMVGLAVAIPDILSKVVQKWNVSDLAAKTVVQKWNMSDLAAKTAEFILYTMWSGFFCTAVVVWTEASFFANPRREIFSENLLQVLSRPAAAPAA
ncbi:MAG TPA: hypothetical protein VLE95_04960 [Chlamydiales bacterium]|nr:hypothetical protein [Chlamydiales bacterium]